MSRERDSPAPNNNIFDVSNLNVNNTIDNIIVITEANAEMENSDIEGDSQTNSQK